MEDDIQINQTQTKEETDKKCPACGGVMDFSPSTGGLECPYCGYQEKIKTEESAAELDFDEAEAVENCDWGTAKKLVVCKSCGAQTVYDELVVSNECPYCGSNQVMEEKGKNTIAPGGVVTFCIDKNNASGRFANWIKGKLFCPSKAKKMAKPKAFTGVYIPYWTFDSDVAADYTGQYGRTRHVRNSRGETVTVVDWYNTCGNYSEFIDDWQTVGTDRYDMSMLKNIEPFNTVDNKKYKPEYIAGFAAERYSIGLKAAWSKAREEIEQYIKSRVENKISGEHAASEVRGVRIHPKFNNLKYKYLLVPVWMSSFKYNGKIYRFMVNGQTGKVGGKTPVSWLRVLAAVLIGAAICALLYYAMEG